MFSLYVEVHPSFLSGPQKNGNLMFNALLLLLLFLRVSWHCRGKQYSFSWDYFPTHPPTPWDKSSQLYGLMEWCSGTQHRPIGGVYLLNVYLLSHFFVKAEFFQSQPCSDSFNSQIVNSMLIIIKSTSEDYSTNI